MLALVYLYSVQTSWPSLLEALGQVPMVLVRPILGYRYELDRFCPFFHDKHDHYNSGAHYRRNHCDERWLHIVRLYILGQ